MASLNVASEGQALDAIDKDMEIDEVHSIKVRETVALEDCGETSPGDDFSEKSCVDDSEKFFNDHAAGDKNSDVEDNTDSATESDDLPVEPMEAESSTLLLVTDLTVASRDEAVDDISKKSSFDLLRLGSTLLEASDSSLTTSMKPPSDIAKELSRIKKPTLEYELQEELALKELPSDIAEEVKVKKTIKKRTLLNDLEVATDAELKEELALIRANHLPRRNWVEELVYWRDPVHTASVFGTLFTLLLATTFYSLVAVVGYAGLALLLCGTILRIFSSASQRSANLQRKSLVELGAVFREENLRRILDVAANHVHPWVLRLRHLLLVESVSDSLQFAGALYALTYVGALLDGLCVMLVAVFLAFLLPPLYEHHKERVDAHVASFHASWDRLVQEARNTAMSPLGKRD